MRQTFHKRVLVPFDVASDCVLHLRHPHIRYIQNLQDSKETIDPNALNHEARDGSPDPAVKLALESGALPLFDRLPEGDPLATPGMPFPFY